MENIKNTRTEHDLLGTRELPADALYGIQTMRGIENFSISKFKLQDYPLSFTDWHIQNLLLQKLTTL